MIRFSDASVLAITKLHSKKVLLISSVILCAILFGILTTIVLISSGVTKSVALFTSTAHDGKYLVRSSPIIPEGVTYVQLMGQSLDVINELESMQSDYVNEQKAIAKKLGREFSNLDVVDIFTPDPLAPVNLPDKQRVRINNQSPVYQRYIEKKQLEYSSEAKTKLSDLKNAAVKYGAIDYFTGNQTTVSYANLQFIDNKEDYLRYGINAQPRNSDLTSYGYAVFSARNSMYEFVDQNMINRFIVSDELLTGDDGAIPVVLSTDEAFDIFEEKLDLAPKPENPVDQFEWYKQLREKVSGHSYQSCYRNDSDLVLLTNALKDVEQKVGDANNPGNIAKKFTYELPKQACGAVTIREDNRTAAEKKIEREEMQLRASLGDYEEASRTLVSFKVVGLVPVEPQRGSASPTLDGFMKDLLSPQYGLTAMIPIQAYEKSSAKTKYDAVFRATPGAAQQRFNELGIGDHIVAFTTIEDAKNFIQKEGCVDMVACDKPFSLQQYGTNYLLLDEFGSISKTVVSYSLLGITVLAALIMSFVMSRIIIDSRRETAVFRAIGAKRVDISAVYGIYTFLVTGLIVVTALFVSLVIGLVVQNLFAEDLNSLAKSSYGIVESGPTFELYEILPVTIVGIAILIISIGFIAILLPLMRNVKRNPLKDMKDE